jgi:DNA-binding NarL/FixJ family response regulator
VTKAIEQVLVADDHPLCREGLTTLFARNLGFSDIFEACDFPAVLARIAGNSGIGLVTVDLGLPGLRKGEGLRDLRIKFPAVRVVVVAATRDRDLVLDALGAGVHGYIPKDAAVDEMLDALRMVLAGQMYVPLLVSDLNARNETVADDGLAHDAVLTGRQYEVLKLLAVGRSNKEIARLLCIAEGTVKVHIAAAFRMLGVHNRVSAAAALRARATHEESADTYLPGLLDETNGPPIFRQNHNRLAQVSYRR